MLHEMLRTLRKQKGYSQEEVAARLSVVRQTVSKWEKGLSVPDADMLVKIAELFEVSVAGLLGGASSQETAQEAPAENAPDPSEIAEQLSRINEQLVIRNRRSRRIWKTVASVLIGLAALWLIQIILALAAFSMYRVDEHSVSVTTEVFSGETSYDAVPADE